MADTTNLERFLTDVADAIRAKRNIEGTISAENFDEEIDSIGTVVEKIVAPAKEIIEEPDVVKIATEPIEQPLVIPENGVAEVLADKTVLAENIGLTPDKIVKGSCILGINGKAEGGVIEASNGRKYHVFYNEDDAKSFTGYAPGDRAIVYGLGEERFDKDTLDAFGTEPDVGSRSYIGSSSKYSSLGVYEKVVLSEPMEFDDGFSWDSTNSNGKSISNKLWIRLTSTSCTITMQGFMSSVATTFTYTYKSADGLTYVLDTIYNGSTQVYSLYRDILAERITTIKEKLEYCWPVIGDVFSKFLCFPNRKILKKIYMYEPQIPEGLDYGFSMDDSVYSIDLQKSTLSKEYTDIVPYGPIYITTLYAISLAIVTGGITVIVDKDDENICYVVDTDVTCISVDTSGNKHIILSSAATTTACNLYKFDLTDANLSYSNITSTIKYISKQDSSAYVADIMSLDNASTVIHYDVTNNTCDNVNIVYVNGLTSNYASIGTTHYAHVGLNPTLREEYLGLRGTTSDVRRGSNAFINEFIEGTFEAGNISLTEEEQINEILDEILGGE